MEMGNIILEQLRLMRADITALKEFASEIAQRQTVLEMGVAGIRREVAELGITIAGQDQRYDRLAARIDRIERRLELTE